MDPLTQGLLGAAFAASFAKRDNLKLAACCGAIGGVAPDIDVFIRSAVDPLISLEYHRHFTHSLAFIPLGGLIITLILYNIIWFKQSFKLVYLFVTIGFATHGLIDSCTSYGTYLYWPFSDERVAWNIISIIDPIYTLTLLVFLVLCLKRRSRILMQVGLGLSLTYLATGYIKNEQIKSFMYETAQNRNHEIERIMLNPSIGNNILWRSVYQADGNYYIDAVYYTFFSPPILREGTSVKVINPETIFPKLPADSQQREDIRRFHHFSNGYIYLLPYHDNIIADLRYGILPYDDQALWGIKINEETPDKHITFGNLRGVKDRHYDEFWLMLNGEFEEAPATDNNQQP